MIILINIINQKKRPSGHNISTAFANNNGGAIPSNLLQIPNTESNSPYIKLCKKLGISAHPARFPEKLPSFFIQFLTEPGDRVLDIFAGSNTTGAAAEKLQQNWIAFEQNQTYLAASALRFIHSHEDEDSAVGGCADLRQLSDVELAKKIFELVDKQELENICTIPMNLKKLSLYQCQRNAYRSATPIKR